MSGNVLVMNSYNSLKHDLLIEPRFFAGLNFSDIALLVVNFEPQIQSKRVSGHIQDLGALLSVLENRNVLKPDNVQALREISRLVRRDLAAIRVEDYTRMVATLSQPQPSPLNVIPQSAPASIPSELTRKVFEKVASNLGPGWRCIFRSRHIDLPEAFLSQLAQSNVVMQEKAYQALEEFRRTKPDVDHVQCVKEALLFNQRGSIVREIDAIIQSFRR